MCLGFKIKIYIKEFHKISQYRLKKRIKKEIIVRPHISCTVVAYPPKAKKKESINI